MGRSLDPARQLNGPAIYGITDESALAGQALFVRAEQALAGGVSILQYRNKRGLAGQRRREAKVLAVLARCYGAVFVINDDVELAHSIGAGVHVGAEDTPVKTARARLGAEAVVGVSCYASVEAAQSAQAAGASYVAFGNLYPSPTKAAPVVARGTLERARRCLSLPICAIGGINETRIPEVRAAGADLIAVVSALFAPERDSFQAARRLVHALDTSPAPPPKSVPSHQRPLTP